MAVTGRMQRHMANGPAIRALSLRFLRAQTWNEARKVLLRFPELLTDAADHEIRCGIAGVLADGNKEAARIYEEHRLFIQYCRVKGLRSVQSSDLWYRVHASMWKNSWPRPDMSVLVPPEAVAPFPNGNLSEVVLAPLRRLINHLMPSQQPKVLVCMPFGDETPLSLQNEFAIKPQYKNPKCLSIYERHIRMNSIIWFHQAILF